MRGNPRLTGINDPRTREQQPVRFDNAAQVALDRTIIAEFRANNGQLSAPLADLPILLLTHVGAKSHAPYLSPLAYAPDEDRLLLVASVGGTDFNPGWYFNLRANPSAIVEVGDQCLRVKARVTEGAERERLFRKAVQTVGRW